MVAFYSGRIYIAFNSGSFETLSHSQNLEHTKLLFALYYNLFIWKMADGIPINRDLENGESSRRFSENTKNLAMVIKGTALPVSLKSTAFVRIACSLWQQDCIRNELNIWCKADYDLKLKTGFYMYKVIEGKVLKSFSKLVIPQNMIKTLIGVIKTVGEQILNFLRYRIYSNQEKVNIYLDNLCWTSRGTINQVTTVSLLFKNDGLSTLEKYELACSICSEKDIQYYLKKLPKFFITSVTEKKLHLMVYMTYFIREDHETLRYFRKANAIYRYSNEEYIYRWSFKAKNEAAMLFFYEKFTDFEIRYKLVCLTENALQYNTLCIPYLMSCMNPTQIQELCRRISYPILNLFASDWRLRNYFIPTANCVLEFIKQMALIDAMKIIILCKNELLLSGNKCKELLQELVLHRPVSIKTSFTSVCVVVLNCLFALEDVAIIHQLLNIGNTEEKKHIIYSAYGMKECSNLITNGRFIVLNIFLKEMLITGNEIEIFKNKFIKDQGFKISCSFIALGQYKLMNQFLSCFQTEGEVELYKIQLPYQGNGIIISNIIKSTIYIDSYLLKAIDKFLNWAFDECVEKIFTYKMDIFHKDVLHNDLKEIFLSQVLKLALLGEVQLLNSYLSWALYSHEKCHYIGNQFFEENSLDICCSLITAKQYQLLDQFLKMFCHPNEMDIFKLSLPIGKQGKIIKEIKKMATSEDTKTLIVNFLSYCFEGKEEMFNSIKVLVIDQDKDIHIHIDCRDIFLGICPMLMEANNWSLLDKYFKWAFS